MFFNIQEILTHNCILNFILGARGCRKTTSTLKYCIDDFLKKGKKFIYLRRYDVELQDLGDLFDWKQFYREYDEYVIDVYGKNFYIAKTEDVTKANGEIAWGRVRKKENMFGKAIYLSTSENLKSHNYIEYNKLVFEEFIINSDSPYKHYLKNEINIFFELISTIFRDRQIRIFFLGNNLKTINPYYTYFGIKNPKQEGITKYKRNGKKVILTYYFKNDEFTEYYKKTDLGTLINGTDYGKYAIDNQSLNDNIEFIEQKTPQSGFMFAMKYRNKKIGFWLDKINGKLYASYKVPKNCDNFYACTREDMSYNTYLFRQLKNNLYMKMFREGVSYGYLYYENIEIKDICQEIIRLFNIH